MKKTTCMLILLVILAIFSLALVRPGLSQLIRHYPTMSAQNAAGCVLNYDLGWLLYGPDGTLRDVFINEWLAARALLVCD